MGSKQSARQTVVYGAGAGVAASLAMAMYAMLAAWAKDTGFFTPLHHIASLVAPDTAMMESMQAAGGGSAFNLTVGTALVGAAIHMMTGAAYGAGFGLLASRFEPSAGLLAGIGTVYGAAVFAASAFVGLPVAAAVFGAGDPIENMAEMAGWGTFAIEHLLFGLALGTILAVALRRRTTAETTAAAHAG